MMAQRPEQNKLATGLMRIFRYLSGDVLSHTAAVALVLFLVVFSGRFH